MRQSAGLTDAEFEQFDHDGFLVLEGLLDPVADLDPILDEYAGVLDRLARELHEKGALQSTYDDLPFGDRVIAVYRESRRAFPQNFDFSLPPGDVTAETPLWHGPAVFAALVNPRMLDMVESIIGPEIYSNPIQHVRIKPPEAVLTARPAGGALVNRTSWHQDNGVVQPSADGTDLLTVWFSLTDATVENGCLQVIPGSHKHGLLTHYIGANGPRIPDDQMTIERIQPVPTRRGDVLLLNRRTCHGSLANTSRDQVRVSIDLRYHPIGQATGRDQFPGFVARSRQAPDSVLPDADAWSDLWVEARTRLAAMAELPPFHRWEPEEPAPSETNEVT